MDSFPGTDDNVCGTAQGPTRSWLSQVFFLSTQVLSSHCTLDGSREEHFLTSTQVLFPRCALDGRREKSSPSDLHSGVIPKLPTRGQQRRASPVTSTRVFFSKCTRDGSKESVPALRVLPTSHQNRNPDPWPVNPVLGPPHASSLLLPRFARGGRDSHSLHLTGAAPEGRC